MLPCYAFCSRCCSPPSHPHAAGTDTVNLLGHVPKIGPRQGPPDRQGGLPKVRQLRHFLIEFWTVSHVFLGHVPPFTRRMHILRSTHAYWVRIGCVLGAYWVRIGCVLGAYWCFADVMTNSRLQVCDGGLAPPAGLWALPAAEEGRRLLRNREDDRDLQGTSSYSDVYSPPRGAAARLTHP